MTFRYIFSAHLVVAFVVCLALPFSSKAADSLRVEKKGGVQYIVHKVDKGETLYSLSRRYKTPVAKIKSANKSLNSSLSIDQVLFIPYEGKISTAKRSKTHTVQPGETLYGISRKYGLSVADIKQINKLSNSGLEVGQSLIVSMDQTPPKKATPIVKKKTPDTPPPSSKTVDRHVVSTGETLYGISRKYNIPVATLKEWNGLSSNNLEIGQILVLSAGQNIGSEKPKTSVTANHQRPVKVETIVVDNSDDNLSGIEQVEEDGFAATIDESLSTKKFLCLHRNAPIGTIVKVKNQMNNKIAYVRVVGKLPDTGINKNLLVRISKPAYDHLGGIDTKFPIYTSYIP